MRVTIRSDAEEAVVTLPAKQCGERTQNMWGEPHCCRFGRWKLSQLNLWLAIVGLAILSGCGSEDARFTVSGTVTYRGKPVPMGEVQFMPDSTQGNRGPAVMATIEDGKYETPDGKGVVGGPYVLLITGYAKAVPSNDPTASAYGPELFRQTRQDFDFPREDCTHDITVE